MTWYWWLLAFVAYAVIGAVWQGRFVAPYFMKKHGRVQERWAVYYGFWFWPVSLASNIVYAAVALVFTVVVKLPIAVSESASKKAEAEKTKSKVS